MVNSKPHNTDVISPSELILNDDGSLYHLKIKEEHVHDNIIIVGDPERVGNISNRFDRVDSKLNSREFCTHSGFLNGVGITVISSGIGVDNIDIVINEVDAAVNIDLNTRKPKKNFRKLNFFRIGTSGTLLPEIDLGSFVASKYAFGFDGVPWFYCPEFSQSEKNLSQAFLKDLKWDDKLARPYFVEASQQLYDKIAFDMIRGITATANGFYGPQGRSLRLALENPLQSEKLKSFSWEGLRITNYEMESAGLYALASMLGHEVLTTCVVLANRANGEFLETPERHINKLIDKILQRLTS